MEAALAGFLLMVPSLVGAFLILVIGWIIAGALGGLVAKALRAIRIDQMAEKAHVTGFLQKAQIHNDVAGIFGALVKWYVRLVVVLLAADAVGLTAISKIVNDVLGFIPQAVVAVVILAVFSWLAGITRAVVSGALGSTSVPNSQAIAGIAYVAVFAFGIMAAATQIGIASTLVNTLFAGFVFALSLAFALAFGLGGREEAAQILHEWRGSAAKAISQPVSTNGHDRDATTRLRETEAAEARRREELATRS